MDLYLFDLDETLYAYNHHKRLPALSAFTGASQYHLTKTWWVGGFELRAVSGEWPTTSEYLAEFAKVTGAALTLEQWTAARSTAMTPIEGSIEALRRCAGLGTVALFSNNPSPLGEALPILAPELVEILGDNILISYQLGVRKPDPRSYELALARYGARPDQTFLADDLAENVAAAVALGIHAHHFTTVKLLDAAIGDFASRATQ